MPRKPEQKTDPAALGRAELFTAADNLNSSDRGRKAVACLKKAFFEALVGLDSFNQSQVLILMNGFFGDFTGTARDAVNGYRPDGWAKTKKAGTEL